jgi:hypothetical protein
MPSEGGQLWLPRSALDLCRKISWIAVYLLLVRVLSAFGFLVALWLCPIQIFANLSVYLASISLASLAVFGRFELLIVEAQDERKCADAFHLCIITAAIVIGATFAVTLAIQPAFLSNFSAIFACSLTMRACLRLGLTLATRNGTYDRAVKALLPHTIGQPAVLLCLIYTGYNPLLAFVLSDFAGHLIAAVCVSASEWLAIRPLLLRRISLQRIRALAARNVGLPTMNLGAVASAFAFATAPLFFLSGLSNGVLAGTFALLFRVLDIPTYLTNSSVGPILMKEVADCGRGNSRKIPGSMFLLPIVVATIVFGSISLGGLTVSDLQLAPSWQMALTLLPVVALFQAGVAATNPLIDIATLAGRQHGLLTLNLTSVMLAALALVIWRHEPIFAIAAAGTIGFGRVILMSFWLVGIGKIPRRLGLQNT